MDKETHQWLRRASIAKSWNEYVYINELGWRSNNQPMWPEPIEESIVLIGCSQTFGGSLPYEDTIAHQLEKLSGRQVLNLGWPGSNNHWIWKMIVDIQTHSTPWAIVVNWTSPIRYYEWHTNRMAMITMPDDTNDKLLFKFMERNPDYLESLNTYIIQSSRLLCRSNHNVDFTWNTGLQNINDLYYIKGVDQVSKEDYHWGPRTNKIASHYVNNQLKDQL